jgi:hypothetical protein
VAALPPNRGLYAGLYLPDLGPTDLAAAAQVALDAGASGVSLFELAGMTEEHWVALSGVLEGMPPL